jgi:acyl-CoA thioesterase II
MSNALAAPREALAEWMKVEQRGTGAYEARLEDHFGETQSADLLARCALAALGERSGALRSLHADWLAPAPPATKIALRALRIESAPELVEVRAETGSAPLCRSTVRVEARATSGGLSYQDVALPLGLPDPDSLPRTVEYARKEGWPEAYAAGPVEFRRVGPLRPKREAGESCDNVCWLSLRAELPRNPSLEQAALVFLACFYEHWEFERRIGERFDHPRLALRSHDVWLHHTPRPDGWLLLRAASHTAAGGRALGARELFARDGTLLASVTSEALVAER